MDTIYELRVSEEAVGPPLRMPWRRSIAMGRAYELLRTDAMSHLAYVQNSVGFEYCRFHGLFHEDMAVVVRDAPGKLSFQWHQVDKVLDGLRNIGLRPFVELGPMPYALASGSQTVFAWAMNVTPPRTWEEWAKLVEAFTQHVTRRYGREEVRRWYFEVWNEPNLDIFWSGTQAEYFKLYDYAAQAVRRVDPCYRVGGPATARAEWIPDFLEHCRKNHIPLDFISTHSYAQDEYVVHPGRVGSRSAPGEFLADVYRQVARVVRNFDPRLEIHWTEWNALTVTPALEIDWVSNPTVDACCGGAFVVQQAMAADAICNSMAYWTASDIFEEMGMAHMPYSGTYGLLNIHGIPKATFRAMELLRKLEGGQLSIESADAFPPGCGVVATRTEDSHRLLIWNNPPPGEASRDPWRLRFSLPKRSTRTLLISTRLSPKRGSAYETWVEMGRPANLSPFEMELLHSHSVPETTFQMYGPGREQIELTPLVASHEVLLLTWSEPEGASPVARASAADITAWAAGMGSPASA